VKAGLEGHIAAERGIDAHRPCDQRRLEQLLRPEQGDEREGARDLRAIEKREAFLGGEAEGGLAEGGQHVGCGVNRAVVPDLALAYQAAGKMRKRGKVTRCADRALGRDDRQGVMGEERKQQPDDLRPHARIAARETCRLEREDEPDDLVRQGRADAAHVREDEPALQLCDLLRRDARGSELAEARVDPVDGGGACGSAIDDLARRLDPWPATIVQRDLAPAGRDRAQLLQRDLARDEGEAHPPSRFMRDGW
jgi:hypothetical protein